MALTPNNPGQGTASDIESESLEAHVRICTIRYDNLNEKLENVDDKVSQLDTAFDKRATKLENKFDNVETAVNALKMAIEQKETKSANRIIGWGVSFVGVLLTACATLAYHVLTAGH